MPDDNKSIYDDLEVGDVPKKGGAGFSGGSYKILVIVMIGILLVGLLLILIFSNNTAQRAAAAKNLPVTETNSEVTAVKAFAIKFLDKFYWYNRDSFLDVRHDLEKMMTTNFLEKYKQIYYDNAFEQDIIDSNLIISPTYDAIMYKKDDSGTYARVLGDIKYTDGRTGAERKRVSTWTLKIVPSEDGQYQVDDYVIEIGK
jgi:hypothetical protein